jgi:hypothetical protein
MSAVECSARYRAKHKDQIRAYKAGYYQKNRARIGEINAALHQKSKAKRRQQNNAWRRAHLEFDLLKGARTRAEKKGLPFNLTLSDIVIPSLCPVLGIPLVVGVGCATDCSPTLDRILPELGYVRGNIAVISRRANIIKSNATAEEIERVAAWVRARRHAGLIEAVK